MMRAGCCKSASSSVILFDAACPLCTWSARFIVRNDPDRRFRFAALQSPAGRKLAEQAGVVEAHVAGASLALMSDGRWQRGSDAALEIAGSLRSPWRVVRLLRVLPHGLREWIYRLVAMHRPRELDVCEPSADLVSRMLPEGNAEGNAG